MSTQLQHFLNESGNYSLLSFWEQFLLNDTGLLSEAECYLKNWINFTYDDNISEDFCDAAWDNFYCWPPSPSESVSSRNCSDVFPQAFSDYSIVLEGKVTRQCLQNGTWAKKESNYRECADSLKSYVKTVNEDNALQLVVQYLVFIGSILSLVCLGASLTIFYFFRSLRCDRVTVQAHLMISLGFRFVLMFIIAEPHVIGQTTSYRDVDFLCESILLGFLYFTFSSVSWMFVQGLYLNFTLIAGLISSIANYHILLYNFIGWVLPAVFVISYAIAMMVKKQKRCWDGYSEMNEMWIILCPIIFEVIVNGIFLMNILRILLRKVRNSHSRPDASQIKAAAKATAILFPVLGVNNLLFLYNPGGVYNKFFVVLNTFFASTQGIFVAIVYCFTNKDVWNAVRRSVRRIHVQRTFEEEQQTGREQKGQISHLAVIELATIYPQPSTDTNNVESPI